MPIKLTSIGLSNSYKRNTKTTINKLQIRSGRSTKGDLIYSQAHPIKLHNTGDDNYFVKVSLD
jgi:hypothetical protein